MAQFTTFIRGCNSKCVITLKLSELMHVRETATIEDILRQIVMYYNKYEILLKTLNVL